MNLSAAGTTISNIEGLGGYGYGIKIDAAVSPAPVVADSWLHSNRDANLLVNGPSLQRNFVELAGFRSDGLVVNSGADGIRYTGASQVTTSRNVVRNNTNNGMSLQATSGSPGLSLADDYACGNGYSGSPSGGASGIVVGQPATGTAATGTGLTTAYNYNDGVRFPVGAVATLTFNNNSTFTANRVWGFNNLSNTLVSAQNNQWRDVPTGQNCLGSPDIAPGQVNCASPQDYIGKNVTLDDIGAPDPVAHPVVPSNAIRNGQTVRVQGSMAVPQGQPMVGGGFNAVHGNPLYTDAGCTIGAGATSSNCCRKPSKANLCDGNSPPDGTPDTGNCTAFKNAVGGWYAAEVTAVTPTTIVAAIPTHLGTYPAFICVGLSNELVRVSKKHGTNQPLWNEKPYCTTVDPK